MHKLFIVLKKFVAVHKVRFYECVDKTNSHLDQSENEQIVTFLSGMLDDVFISSLLAAQNLPTMAFHNHKIPIVLLLYVSVQTNPAAVFIPVNMKLIHNQHACDLRRAVRIQAYLLPCLCLVLNMAASIKGEPFCISE